MYMHQKNYKNEEFSPDFDEIWAETMFDEIWAETMYYSTGSLA